MPDLSAELETLVQQRGPVAAIDRLIESLRADGEFGALFYALLVKSRLALGVSPIPSQPAAELPPEHHAAYEEAIRVAARTVGGLLLDRGDIPSAWNYFRLIGDPQPIRAALETLTPAEDADIQPLVDIAFHQNVYPERGFDFILDRNGICSAITLTSSFESAMGAELKTHCVKRLVRALDQQLRERLCALIGQREPTPGDDVPLDALLAGRDWLFDDDGYHTDPSHLSSVVHLSTHLPRCDEVHMARVLCHYGSRLPESLRYAGDPPFEDLYTDAGVYLRAIAGEDIDSAISHFRAKAATAETGGTTTPAETLVKLLLACGREKDALTAAREFLLTADERQLSCPGPLELARRQSDFQALSEIAKERGDVVQYLAGLIAMHQ